MRESQRRLLSAFLQIVLECDNSTSNKRLFFPTICPHDSRRLQDPLRIQDGLSVVSLSEKTLSFPFYEIETFRVQVPHDDSMAFARPTVDYT